MMSEQSMLLAVYGTLRKGQHNWVSGLQQAKLVSDGEAVQGWTMRTNGGFPACFRSNDSNAIVVDIFDVREVPAAMLERIDRMELNCGYEVTHVTSASGHSAKMYIMSDENSYRFPTLIPSGNWFDYIGRK